MDQGLHDAAILCCWSGRHDPIRGGDTENDCPRGESATSGLRRGGAPRATLEGGECTPLSRRTRQVV